jgi:hypothetical protein
MFTIPTSLVDGQHDQSSTIVTLCSTIAQQKSQVDSISSEMVQMRESMQAIVKENDILKAKLATYNEMREDYVDVSDSLRAHRTHMDFLNSTISQLKKKQEELERIVINQQNDMMMCYKCKGMVRKLEFDLHLEDCDECPICCYYDPNVERLIIKGCGHKVCVNCLPRIESRRTISCPVCQKVSSKQYLKEYFNSNSL